MSALAPVEAAGWDLQLTSEDGQECLRVWWLGHHVADCRTIEDVLREVPLAVLRAGWPLIGVGVEAGRSGRDCRTDETARVYGICVAVEGAQRPGAQAKVRQPRLDN